MKNIRTEHLTTDARVQISKFIQQGRTKITDCKQEAIKFAKEQNSYHYDIYEDGKSTGLYGIPK